MAESSLGSFMQSPAWALVKPAWQSHVLLSTAQNGAVAGGMQVLCLPRPGQPALLYAPRGPVCNFSQKEVLCELIQGAAALGKLYGPCVFQADPLVEASDKAAIAALQEAGLSFTPASGPKENIQPRFNYQLSLLGETEESLLANFGSNTRRKIHKAQRDGLECKPADKAELEAFYPLFLQTGERQGFSVRPKAYLKQLLFAFGEDARLYLCRLGGRVLAGAIAVRAFGKVHFLYGATALPGPELPEGVPAAPEGNHYPCYLLQWEMIRWALESGCSLYDFGGICTDPDENPSLYGVYQFKKQFHGEVTEYAGLFKASFPG